MRRNATRRIPIVRSRSCIRKRRGRHRRPDASRTSSHASLNKPMRRVAYKRYVQRIFAGHAAFVSMNFPFLFFEFVRLCSSFTPSRLLEPSLSSDEPRCLLFFFYYSRSFYSWFFIRRCALGERTSASMRKPAYYFARNMHLKLVFLSDTVQ